MIAIKQKNALFISLIVQVQIYFVKLFNLVVKLNY